MEGIVHLAGQDSRLLGLEDDGELPQVLVQSLADTPGRVYLLRLLVSVVALPRDDLVR